MWRYFLFEKCTPWRFLFIGFSETEKETLFGLSLIFRHVHWDPKKEWWIFAQDSCPKWFGQAYEAVQPLWGRLSSVNLKYARYYYIDSLRRFPLFMFAINKTRLAYFHVSLKHCRLSWRRWTSPYFLRSLHFCQS